MSPKNSAIFQMIDQGMTASGEKIATHEQQQAHSEKMNKLEDENAYCSFQLTAMCETNLHKGRHEFRQFLKKEKKDKKFGSFVPFMGSVYGAGFISKKGCDTIIRGFNKCLRDEDLYNNPDLKAREQDVSLDYYEALGLALTEQVPQPTKPLGTAPGAKLMYEFIFSFGPCFSKYLQTLKLVKLLLKNNKAKATEDAATKELKRRLAQMENKFSQLQSEVRSIKRAGGGGGDQPAAKKQKLGGGTGELPCLDYLLGKCADQDECPRHAANPRIVHGPFSKEQTEAVYTKHKKVFIKNEVSLAALKAEFATA